MSAQERALRTLNGRVQMMLGRAVLAAVNDDPQMQELQLELLSDETQDGIEHFQPYGFTAHPKPGAEAIMAAIGGLRSHGVALSVGDRRYRIKVAEGEVAIHDDQNQKVHLTRDGIVIAGKALTVTSEGATEFTCDSFKVTASGAIAFNGDDITIGNGASLAAARKTDAVAGSAISGGSTKVKIA
jgi:phage baseplate assembly protein V